MAYGRAMRAAVLFCAATLASGSLRAQTVIVPAPPLQPNQYGEYVAATLASDVLTLTTEGRGLRALYRVRAESGASDTVARIEPPSGATTPVGTIVLIQPAQLGTLTVDDGNFIALAGGSDFAMDSPLDVLGLLWDGGRWREIWRTERDLDSSDEAVVWRSYTGTRYQVLVPMAPESGSSDGFLHYARFDLFTVGGGVTIGAIGEVVPGVFLAHSAGSGVAKTGTWINSTVAGAPTPNAAYSVTPGDTIEFTATGRLLAVNHPVWVNGGRWICTVDGEVPTGGDLPLVAASDFKSVSAAADNGSGLLRVTTTDSHGLLTGGRVYANGLGGITLPSAGPWTVTVVSSKIVDLEGTSGWSGAFTSGGSLSYFRSSDLGSAHGTSGPCGINVADAWHVLARDLADEEHTIEFEVLGTTEGGSLARAYFNGVAAAADDTAFSEGTSTGVLPVKTLDVHDFRLVGQSSNIVTAPHFRLDSGGSGAYEAATGLHGNETQSSATYTLDGATLSLAADEYAIGYEAGFASVGELTYGGDKAADFTQEYRFSVGGSYQARALCEIAWAEDGSITSDYRGMLPIVIRQLDTGIGSPVSSPYFDRFSIDGTVFVEGVDYGDNLGAVLANYPGAVLEAFSTTHSLRATMRRPDGQRVNQVDYEDRADGADKGYFNYQVGNSSRAFDSSTVDLIDVGWHLRRGP